jgi:hypothetical protein
MAGCNRYRVVAWRNHLGHWFYREVSVMKIQLTGDIGNEMEITLEHEGHTMRAVLFKKWSGWHLSGRAGGATSFEGVSIGNKRTHWPSAIGQAVAFLRERQTYRHATRLKAGSSEVQP